MKLASSAYPESASSYQINSNHPLATFTMKPSFLLAMLVIAAVLFVPALAHAGDGHDHGEAAPAAAGTALPRFAAVSDAFELVGVLDGKRITLWLDRADDNAPVTGARIELDIAGEKLQAGQHDDAYEVVLASELQPGVLPITATVTAGSEIDLLAGELDLHEDAHADAATPARPWVRYAAWAAGIAAALAALLVIGRRMAASRQRRAGAAA